MSGTHDIIIAGGIEVMSVLAIGDAIGKGRRLSFIIIFSLSSFFTYQFLISFVMTLFRYFVIYVLKWFEVKEIHGQVRKFKNDMDKVSFSLNLKGQRSLPITIISQEMKWYEGNEAENNNNNNILG